VSFNAGAPGSGQGPLSAASALLNAPFELELSSDDGRLIIVDYLNQRLAVADFTAQPVPVLRTRMGTC
jgi:hypothetical protein